MEAAQETWKSCLSRGEYVSLPFDPYDECRVSGILTNK
jgi:hypothetical protein